MLAQDAPRTAAQHTPLFRPFSTHLGFEVTLIIWPLFSQHQFHRRSFERRRTLSSFHWNRSQYLNIGQRQQTPLNTTISIPAQSRRGPNSRTRESQTVMQNCESEHPECLSKTVHCILAEQSYSRLTVSQSVSLGVEPNLGLSTRDICILALGWMSFILCQLVGRGPMLSADWLCGWTVILDILLFLCFLSQSKSDVSDHHFVVLQSARKGWNLRYRTCSLGI
jgi:hypothetical protein